MKYLKFWAVLMLVGLLAAGCGKKSGLEGKVVDGKGQPMANVKVVVSQVQPIKGYEQFEATTGSDGTFHFGKLFPSSEYALFPWSDAWVNTPMMTVQYDPTNLRIQFYKGGWITDRKMTVQSGPEGETMILPAPVIVKQAISTVEGKILNGRGQPFANLKVEVKQAQPMKGYEQFETTTGADGTFRFDKLFPASDYTLTAHEDEFVSKKGTVKTGLEEQTVTLSSQIVFRFLVSSDGVVRDSRTGLDWAVGADRDTNYAQAEQWVANCRLAGGGWRMPTHQELKTLYQQGVGERNMDTSFKTTGWWVWAEPKDSSSAWDFDFNSGTEPSYNRRYSDDNRVFGVRSRPR
jgi:hypothetical protein